MPLSLLDEEGALTDQFEAVLREVFLRFASRHPGTAVEEGGKEEEGRPGVGYDVYQNGWTASREDLNEFAKATNGQSMTDETFEEIETYFEMLDSRLVFKGFMQLYQLQAENDEEETSKDLVAWGYDLETLELKYTVAEEKEEKEVEEDEVKGKEENVKEV